jgi:hypothetical protein
MATKLKWRFEEFLPDLEYRQNGLILPNAQLAADLSKALWSIVVENLLFKLRRIKMRKPLADG